MPRITIQNLKELATTPARAAALAIAEVGLNAIDTERAVTSAVTLVDDGTKLKIKDLELDLTKFKSIRIVGFGKAACEGAGALVEVLQEKIKDGVVIDVKDVKCEFITNYVGTHPEPSEQNVLATEHIVKLAKELTADDLVLVVVSGGGSALLCWPASEFVQGKKLYDDFLRVGGNIEELNTVRKHISALKGGGLAKLLYPATVVGLVFCDVPGDHVEEVASGPTFKDASTIADAQVILDKYHLSGFDLTETPKDDIFFEKVHNILLVSNGEALRAMAAEAASQGYRASVVSSEIYSESEVAVASLKKAAGAHGVALGGGEVKLVVSGDCGSGGRCSYLALAAMPFLNNDDVFIALASDGVDNSDSAGAIVDGMTEKAASALGLNPDEYKKRFDSYEFFKRTGGLLFTGPTGANVSDLMLWLTQASSQ
jgi:glycerate-2-kinase